MGTGRLPLAVLPGLILLSLSPAEWCSGAAGVFMQPQLRARAGDSVLLQCLFIDPDSKGWTLHKVDWLHKAGDGTQVGRDGVAGCMGHVVAGEGGRGSRGEAALERLWEAQPAACRLAVRRGSFHERKKGPRAGARAGEVPLWVLHPGAFPERGEQPTGLAQSAN